MASPPNIARPDPPDNPPAGDLDRILGELPIAIARLRALAIMVGFAIGAALGLAGCWWAHQP